MLQGGYQSKCLGFVSRHDPSATLRAGFQSCRKTFTRCRDLAAAHDLQRLDAVIRLPLDTARVNSALIQSETTVPFAASNSRSFDCASADPQKRRVEKQGGRFAQDDKSKQVLHRRGAKAPLFQRGRSIAALPPKHRSLAAEKPSASARQPTLPSSGPRLLSPSRTGATTRAGARPSPPRAWPRNRLRLRC